ncbi:1-phosphofructokinase family hexose kinase [Rhizobium halophilum]|uniref:1-phosphofructokinase family hexose kinase n=1 Tax=Rhizobium halophilum TaxID=2846852 RepID=UPI001EFE46AA|nr:1-phosphofructokinase family hexose kinase [Rhizobium halophilum]MCF6369473.1 1-phosphofructokinase family hexose kinase [Rhizobium halophilum]
MTSVLCVALNPSIDLSNETDQVAPTQKVRTRNQRQNIGGGGVNVARVLAELGEKPDLLVMAGGATGVVFLDAVRQMPVNLHCIPIQGAIRIAFMVKEMKTGREYRFVPEGPEVSAEEYGEVLRFLEHTAADYVILSGSLPRGVPMNAYAEMARLFGQGKTRFILDASGEALKEALDIGGLFMIKPSLDELEGIVGYPLDEAGAIAASQDLIGRGAVEHVCVSMARKGALLVSAATVTKAPSFNVPVGSTVGAGDSFVGAMVWGLIRNYPIEDAFRLGVAAGAATVISQGTDLCKRDDVFELYERGETAFVGTSRASEQL